MARRMMPLSRAQLQGMAVGDPFFGILGRALGAIGKLAGRALGIGGRAAPAARTAGTAVAVRTPPIVRPAGGPLGSSGTLGRVLGAIGTGGLAAGALGGILGVGSEMAVRGVAGFLGPGEAPRRRRMNPLNPKALRRATRRLSSFNKFAVKTQKELAKLAPPRRRAPAPRHHDHHDHHN